MINIRYLDIRTGTIVGLAGQLGWPGNVCGTENLCQPLSLSHYGTVVGSNQAGQQPGAGGNLSV